jgi:hypothetical protein
MAPTDELAFTIIPENTASGQNVSGTISPYGSALNFYMAQRNFSANGYNFLNLRHQGLVSRFGGGRNSPNPLPLSFNQELLTQSMPGQVFPMVLEPIGADTIEAATNAGEPLPFIQFALMAGCETSEFANGGIVGGRKFPSRPFLHSSPLQPHVIDRVDGTAPYNHGWNWWVDEMNSVLEALVQESQAGNGFHGGGFSAESGTTHVLQAIGNSYANPNLAAEAAFNPAWKRHCDQDDGERDVTFADHSYLGGTKFALKPGTHTIIKPREMTRREGAAANQFFTELFFRKEEEARPFFSSTWPANEKARSMVFFYHDTHNERLRMHTIRDYIP